MNRRGFMQAILAAGVAPYVSTVSGVLMPVKKILAPVSGMALMMEFGRWENFRFIKSAKIRSLPKNAGDFITYRRWRPYRHLGVEQSPIEDWTVPVADWMHPDRYRRT